MSIDAQEIQDDQKTLLEEWKDEQSALALNIQKMEDFLGNNAECSKELFNVSHSRLRFMKSYEIHLAHSIQLLSNT